MPDQAAVGLENPREFRDYPRVVGRVCEKSERREKIEDDVEPIPPSRGKAPHVAVCITEIRTGSPIPGDLEQLARIVEPIDIVTRFSKEVCVPALAAGDIEDARADR